MLMYVGVRRGVLGRAERTKCTARPVLSRIIASRIIARGAGQIAAVVRLGRYMYDQFEMLEPWTTSVGDTVRVDADESELALTSSIGSE